jgi:hypothetical protein
MIQTIQKLASTASLLSVLTLASSNATAVPMDFDFSGTFTKDNDVVLLNFDILTDSTITIFSSSWDDGGFDPILAIWNSATGAKLQEQDDGGVVGSTLSNGVSYTHGDWDSYYSLNLAAGSYTASITQYDNFAVGGFLSDGFVFDADANFTASYGCSNGQFCGVNSASNRTADWSFHILNVDGANQVDPGTIPEPSSIALFGLAIAGFATARKNRKA